MRLRHIRLLMPFVICAFSAPATAQDSVIAVAGVYKGRQPCEECKYIEAELELNYGTDSTGEFVLRDKYVNPGGTNITSRRKGDWIVRRDEVDGQKAWVVVLDYDNEDKMVYYLVKADGSICPLDENKHQVKGEMDCTMKKQL